MSDSILAIAGKDFVLLGAEASAGFSIIVMKHDEDKIKKLDDTKLLAASGQNGDRVQFCEFIQKNMNLYRYVNDRPLETKSAANYIRGTLATALRKNPYQVNLLLGGYDEETGGSLYLIDYLSSMQKVNFGAHGYGGYFSLSIMDKYYHDDLTLDEAKDIMKKCISEIQKRLLLNSPAFIYKAITKDGIQEVKL
eukprot:gene1587-12712_t